MAWYFPTHVQRNTALLLLTWSDSPSRYISFWWRKVKAMKKRPRSICNGASIFFVQIQMTKIDTKWRIYEILKSKSIKCLNSVWTSQHLMIIWESFWDCGWSMQNKKCISRLSWVWPSLHLNWYSVRLRKSFSGSMTSSWEWREELWKTAY